MNPPTWSETKSGILNKLSLKSYSDHVVEICNFDMLDWDYSFIIREMEFSAQLTDVSFSENL